MPADQDHVRLSFGHTGSNRSNAYLGNQLDRDPRLRIGILQVKYQLRQILDGIDIMMRRGRDQHNPRSGMPHLGDRLVDFMSRQLTAFTRLGALRHFDLKLAGVGQIIDRDTEPGRCDLFDRTFLGIAVRKGFIPRLILATFPGITRGSQAIHSDRDGLVSFFADGAE